MKFLGYFVSQKNIAKKQAPEKNFEIIKLVVAGKMLGVRDNFLSWWYTEGDFHEIFVKSEKNSQIIKNVSY